MGESEGGCVAGGLYRNCRWNTASALFAPRLHQHYLFSVVQKTLFIFWLVASHFVN